VYFGPAILLMLLIWPRVSAAARELGVGFVVFLTLGLCVSLNSESRVITQYIPGFALALSLALSRMPDLPRWGWGATGIFCVAFSKVWMSMSGPDRIFSGKFFEFPEQRYFMNFGPWMSLQTYLIQGAAALAVALVLALWLYGPRSWKDATEAVRKMRARGLSWVNIDQAPT
jgi:hypothetical protein